MTTLRTEVITSEEGFQAIEREWTQLHEKAGGTVFQSHRWLSTWWDVYRRPNLSLRIAAVREGDGLIAILPAFVEATNLRVATLRRMRFLGAFEVYGEYAPLFHPEREPAAIDALAAFCAAELAHRRCDILTFFRFPKTSASMGLFQQELEKRRLHIQRTPDAVPRVTMRLPGDWETYLKSLSSAEQELLKRRSRSLQKNGAELEIVTEPRDGDFDDFVRLHTAAWTERGIAGYFGSPKFEEFQRRATEGFMREKRARLYFLRKDGVRFAAVHAFFMHNQCCFYLSGLDRTHELVRYSPGKVLLSYVIRDAISERYEIFDFQGGTEEYKFRLGGKSTAFSKSVVWHKGPTALKVLPILALQALYNFLVGGVWAYQVLPRLRKLGLASTRHAEAPAARARREPAGDLTIEEHGALAPLEAIWNETVRKSAQPSLYLTFEWLSTWWECHQNPRRELRVIVVKEAGEVIGIAPLVAVQKNVLGFRFRVMEFLSMTRYAYTAHNFSGSLDFIITRRHQEVVAAIFDALDSAEHRWHYVRLHPIPDGSQTMPLLRAEAKPRGLFMAERTVFFNAVTHIATGWAQYEQTLSNSLRRDIRNKLTRLSRKGLVEIEHFQGGEGDDALFAELLDIEARSWKARHGHRIDARENRDFYRRIFAVAANRRWLELWILKVDGVRIAYDFGVAFDGRVEVLKGSYDSHYRTFAPGKILCCSEMEYFFQNRFRSVNLLWGDLAFKLQWLDRAEPHMEVYLFRNTLIGTLLSLSYIRSGMYRLVRAGRNAAQKGYWKLGRG